MCLPLHRQTDAREQSPPSAGGSMQAARPPICHFCLPALHSLGAELQDALQGSSLEPRAQQSYA